MASKRSREAQNIRRRAERAIAALQRDVAAGNVTKAFAARREQSLREVIFQNTYDRKSKSYGASAAVASRRAEKVFDLYNAEAARKQKSLSSDDRRKQITPAKERAFRADIEAALRGELSLEKMEDAEAFIKSTAGIWADASPENRLDKLAAELGYLKGEEDSLIRAYRRWKREIKNKKNPEDYQGWSFDELNPSEADARKAMEVLHAKYKRKDTALEKAKSRLKDKFD